MKRWMLGIGSVLVAIRVYADESGFRAFSSTDGRVIEARILAYDVGKGKVEIERRNGVKLWVSPAVFTEADQRYIQDWKMSEIALSRQRLIVDINKKVVLADRYHRVVDGWQSHFPGVDYEDLVYELSIDNRNQDALVDMKVDYCIFYQSTRKGKSGTSELRDLSDGSKGWFSTSTTSDKEVDVPYELRGSIVIPQLAAKKKYEARTDEIRLRDGVESQYGEASGNTRNYKTREVEDKAIGVIVRISIPLSSGEYASREYSLPKDLVEKREVDWSKKQRVAENDSVLSPYNAFRREADQYEKGDGVEMDLQKALDLNLKAYEVAPSEYSAGNVAWQIGDLYMQLKPQRDVEQAIIWLKRAVERKCEDAGWRLADIYATDRDPAVRDGEQAVKYAKAY